MPRPKRIKKEKIGSTSFDEFSTSNLFLPTNSTSDFHLNNTRVVVNPAVLRYLEQNRLGSPKTLISLDENLLSSTFEIIDHDDELFWDFTSYSNEFLTTAKLARCFLDHHGHLSKTSFDSNEIHLFR